MIDEEKLLQQAELHDIEYELCLVIDNETVHSVIDADVDVVTGQISQDSLDRALMEYLTDEIVSGDEDYYDRHSKEVL